MPMILCVRYMKRDENELGGGGSFKMFLSLKGYITERGTLV